MKRLSIESLRIAAAAAVCLVLSFVSSMAQISQTSQTDASKQTVNELLSNSKARFAIVSKSVLSKTVDNDEIRARIVLTNPDGSTAGGYGAPYIQSKDEMLRLWREFLTVNLNITTQPDEFFVTETRITPDTSFAVAFVLDHSPSTTMPRAIRMQRALQTALTQFEANDFVSIIKFTGRINVEVPATNDKAEYASKFLVNGLNMRASGSAVFDAAARGIEEIAGTTAGRRLLVLFTDGEDNASSMSMQDVIALAKKTNTEIHTISYGVGNNEVLSTLAMQTGGRTHQLEDVYDFDKVFMGIYVSMRHFYDVVIHTNASSRVTDFISPHSTIASDIPHRSIQPMELLPLMPTRGIQVNNPSSRSDQSLTLSVDLKFEGEASEISAVDLLLLDSIATVLVQRADLALEIVPGSDGPSVAPKDVIIAQGRATAIRDFLVRRGVHPSRVRGYSSRPPSLAPDLRGRSSKATFVFTKM